ncbi:unnamed protein product [Pleuronectes platessa]|uniref:Uncharacterized protein n=1 Tax=Pleuronectes platessa TaxID=8262 RepID=A0A9N7W2H6_PLEPL|nr:unnamed protein product [Pleuronectes platessa]
MSPRLVCPAPWEKSGLKYQCPDQYPVKWRWPPNELLGLRPATQRPEKIQPSWRFLGTGGKGRQLGEGWREGWMDGEQEQQVKGVVRRQRAVWSSMVTQQLVLRKVLLRENLTQRNKGSVVVSSWSLKDRKCRLFLREEKH